jgi:hypothetical protein
MRRHIYIYIYIYIYIVNEQRNILREIRKWKANWIGHILRRNCLLKQVIEGKIKGEIEVTRRRWRRRKKLLDDLKDRRGCSHLKEEALDRTIWRNRFGRGVGPVARQNTEWMNTFLFHVFRYWTLFRLRNRVTFFVASSTEMCTVMYCTRWKDSVTEAGFKSWHARRMVYTRSHDFRFVFHGRKPRWQHVTPMGGCVAWRVIHKIHCCQIAQTQSLCI